MLSRAIAVQIDAESWGLIGILLFGPALNGSIRMQNVAPFLKTPNWNRKFGWKLELGM